METEVAPGELLGGRCVLRTFVGTKPTPSILDAIAGRRAAGVTLFRAKNIEGPAQVRALVEALQDARPTGDPPLLIAIDQEGGQLQAIDDGVTAWPGDLALGATDSEELAERTGRALATEMAALGVNLLLAPVCDLLRPGSAVGLGTRPFGDDPERVAALAAAMIRGIRSTGIAAVGKHFPGLGRAGVDSHVALPVNTADRTGVEDDLRPFRSAVEARVDAVMLGHIAVPAITGSASIPATTSRRLAHDLLRGDLGFEGVTMTDALDMGGAGDPQQLTTTVVDAMGAGVDLLLLVHGDEVEERVVATIDAAVATGWLDRRTAEAAASRVTTLRERIGVTGRPGLEDLRAPAHLALARETADRAITLLWDRGGMLPLRGDVGRRLVVAAPDPADLTPAETSSFVRPVLVDALRERGVDAVAVAIPMDPSPADVARVVATVRGEGSPVLVGTIESGTHPGQTALVEALEAAGTPVIAVALRAPFDSDRHPRATAAVCTYGVQLPLMVSLADALVGRTPFAGRLPVRLRSLGAATSAPTREARA